jgi:uncharacterized protein YhbP (UPF0306 family)
MSENKLMQLATLSEDGSPWMCSVWFGFDDDLNIYFFSATNRQHSQEIEKDNRVAGAIAKPHAVSDVPRAIQLKGTAEKLIDKNVIAHARSVYEDRIFDSATIDKLMVHPERPHVFYKIIPSKFVLFDAVNFPESSRQEYIPNA